MGSESVMILGAGPLQVPAIKKIKDYGMKVYACDFNPNATGFLYSDEALLISTVDKEAVLKAAKEKKPDYILTCTSDAPIVTVAYVCEKLGKPTGISYENAICATNKYMMRLRMKKYGLPIPEFYSSSNFIEFKKAVKRFDRRCIIKPADSSASRGVQLVYVDCEEESLRHQYIFTRKYSKTGIVMVEEFMEGPEISVECIIIDSKVTILTITDKIVCELPFFVEIGHSEPSILSIETQEKIKKITIECIKAIGIVNGCAHVELKVTTSGPKIVEIAARLGGDYITSKLVPLSTGVDMVEASLAIAMKKPYDIEIKKNAGSAIRFLGGYEGKLKEIKINNSIYKTEGLEEIEFYCRPGDNIRALRSSNDRIGHIITTGKDAKEAINIANYIMSEIKLIIDKDN